MLAAVGNVAARLADVLLTFCFLPHLLPWLQLACATAIVIITSLKLHNVKLNWDGKAWNANLENTCLLGTMDNGTNLCYFAYAAGGISIIATAALSILQCCTCHFCGLGGILDTMFAAAGTFLWMAAGIIFNTYNKKPAMDNAPQKDWRMSITVLSFCACALFGVMAIAAVYSMLSACCSCCKGSSHKTKVVYKDVEKGHGQFMSR